MNNSVLYTRNGFFLISAYRLSVCGSFFGLILILFICFPAQAQRTVTTEAGATLRIYSPEDGIPSLAPTNAFVARDGYLWLSTTGGTVRISGNEIEDFGAEYGLSLMQHISYDRDQDIIWFTDSESLARFDGTHVTWFDADDGFLPPGGARKQVGAMLADSQGRFWIGTFTPPLDSPYNGGLVLYENGQFKTFSEDELPLHNISGIFEASDGSIWLSSQGYQSDGYMNNHSRIARFKNDEFELFDTPDACLNVGGTFREPDGSTVSIIEDNHGGLWFQCFGKFNITTQEREQQGLYFFNGTTFESIDRINEKLIDGVQIGGLFYDSDNDKLYVTLSRQNGFSDQDISNTILVYRDDDWHYERILFTDNLRNLLANQFDTDELIYWGFYLFDTGDGSIIANLQTFDRATNRRDNILFRKVEHEWHWMDILPGGFILMNLPGNVFLTAHNDPDVLGMYTPPYSRLLTEDDGLLKLPIDATDGGGYYRDRFFIDTEGNVWITYLNSWDTESETWDAMGVSMWNGERILNFSAEDGFSSNNLFFVTQSVDGTLWFPSDRGVNRMIWDGTDYQISTIYDSRQQPFRSTRVVERANGEIYTFANYVAPASENRPEYTFFLAKLNGEAFEPYDPPYPDSLMSLPYHDYELTTDRENRLWLNARFATSNNGLFTAASNLRILEGDTWVEPPSDWQVPDTRLFYVGELENGRYFVVDGGFYKFDFDRQRFIDLSDSTNVNADFRILQRVNTTGMYFYIEGDDHLYIRFRDMGVAVFDGINLTYLDRRNGLPSLRISYPNKDRNGDMLFTTPTGGVIFSGTDFTAIRDDAVSGGAARAIARDKNNNILIQYLGMGITVTQMDTTRYPVRLASIRADTLRFFEAQTARLKANQNSVEFRFVTLNFTNPDEVQFSSFLEGFDQEWSRPARMNFVEYRNLPPGNYTFHVRSISPGNVLSEDTSFSFTIAPPWWRSWWAYSVYVLIFAGGVIATDRVQRKRLIVRERERARERELEQAREIEKAYHQLEKAHENLKSAQQQLVQQEKLASLGQLTAGIAHEIKNPLNFVNNFSDLSLELLEEVRAEVKNSPLLPVAGTSGRGEAILEILDDIEANLRKIHEHGSRADNIVKSMLQHSRGGSGVMEPADLNELIREYVNLAFHGMRAGKNPINVDIDLQLDTKVGEVPLIAEDFSRVVLNLCNNAFDAMREKIKVKNALSDSDSRVSEKAKELSSPRGSEAGAEGDYKPKLIVRTRQKRDVVLFEVEDNGPGIPKEIRDKILQPFFTTKKGTEGTGLGLSITNDIVNAHGGRMLIESNRDEGTMFTIQLSGNFKQTAGD